MLDMNSMLGKPFRPQVLPSLSSILAEFLASVVQLALFLKAASMMSPCAPTSTLHCTAGVSIAAHSVQCI